MTWQSPTPLCGHSLPPRCSVHGQRGQSPTGGQAHTVCSRKVGTKRLAQIGHFRVGVGTVQGSFFMHTHAMAGLLCAVTGMLRK